MRGAHDESRARGDVRDADLATGGDGLEHVECPVDGLHALAPRRRHVDQGRPSGIGFPCRGNAHVTLPAVSRPVRASGRTARAPSPPRPRTRACGRSTCPSRRCPRRAARTSTSTGTRRSSASAPPSRAHPRSPPARLTRTPPAPIASHHRHVVDPGMPAGTVVGEPDLVVHVVGLLRLADQPHVAVVDHHQDERHLVLDRDGDLLHEELEGVVADHAHHELLGRGELGADARRHLPPERPRLPAAEVVARLVGELELAAPDLVQADRRDEHRVLVEVLVELPEHARRLDRRVVEVGAPDQCLLELGDASQPVAPRPVGPRRRLLAQRAERQPGVADDAEVGREHAPDLLGRDVDLDEPAVAAVDVDVAGVAIAEARADGEHDVALQEDLVGEALARLDPHRPGPQRMVLRDRALPHQRRRHRDAQLLGQRDQLARRIGQDHAPAREDDRALGLGEQVERGADGARDAAPARPTAAHGRPPGRRRCRGPSARRAAGRSAPGRAGPPARRGTPRGTPTGAARSP